MTEEAKRPAWALNTIFPTNVLVRDWPADKLNASLKAAIWKDRALDPDGLYRSNQAGTWHSSDHIMQRIGDPGERLRKMFGEGFMSYAHSTLGLNTKTHTCDVRMSAWAMVYSNGGYAAVHTHPNCHASAVYYVDDTNGDDDITMATGVRVKPGDIEFVDTRRGGEFQISGLKMNQAAIFKFKAGRMLIFPSHLPHYVHPIRGDGERISVACNATFHLKEKPNESNEQH